MALLFLAFMAQPHRADSQTGIDAVQSPPAYNVKVSVDEVSLTFRATDAHGIPVNDLKLNELSLLDEGKPPRKVLAFQFLQDFPIRAGILLDTSQSMEATRSTDRAIAIQYAQHLLRQQTDQAFIMNFDVASSVAQDWTSDPASLSAGIRNRRITADGGRRMAGTAIFDALYRACLNQFSHIENTAAVKFILLFTDGEDNASRATLKQAVDMCQRANTAIYAFQPGRKTLLSEGPKILQQLASETGGRLFSDDDSEAGIDHDLRTIDADLRNQYCFIYKPPEMRHDGSFRHVELNASQRVASINVRSGYYAPAQ